MTLYLACRMFAAECKLLQSTVKTRAHGFLMLRFYQRSNPTVKIYKSLVTLLLSITPLLASPTPLHSAKTTLSTDYTSHGYLLALNASAPYYPGVGPITGCISSSFKWTLDTSAMGCSMVLVLYIIKASGCGCMHLVLKREYVDQLKVEELLAHIKEFRVRESGARYVLFPKNYTMRQ